MSVLDRRQQMKQANRMATINSQASVAHMSSDDDFFHASEDLDYAQDTGHLIAILRNQASSEVMNTKMLRIKVDSDYEILHDRYMSSEEEPSPSPDSERGSENGDVDLEQDPAHVHEIADDKANDGSLEAMLEVATPEVALAVPIMSIGRPRLIDVTSLAPMHKRKRSSTERLSRNAMYKAANQTPEYVCEQQLEKPLEVVQTPLNDTMPSDPPIPKEPKDTEIEKSEAPHPQSMQADLPVESQDAHQARLVRRDSINVLRRKQGSVARARKQISRTSSKEFLPRAGDKPQIKRLRRMQARAADERLNVPFIPAYPEDGA